MRDDGDGNVRGFGSPFLVASPACDDCERTHPWRDHDGLVRDGAIWREPDRPCPVCGSTETVEIHDELQSILICANCGSDEP